MHRSSENSAFDYSDTEIGGSSLLTARDPIEESNILHLKPTAMAAKNENILRNCIFLSDKG